VGVARAIASLTFKLPHQAPNGKVTPVKAHYVMMAKEPKAKKTTSVKLNRSRALV